MIIRDLNKKEMKRVYKLEEIGELAKEALPLLAHRVVLMKGEMGMGKTTFVKELCRELGVKGTVSSPTFSLVNEYEGSEGMVYHFDFYRIKDVSEAVDFGVEDYMYSGNWCFMEWSEKVADILPEEVSVIEISKGGEGNEREMKVYNLWG